jgi:hypothetical protein
MIITHFISLGGGGGILKVGDEQFVFAKKIVGNQHKKICTIENLTKDYLPHA